MLRLKTRLLSFDILFSCRILKICNILCTRIFDKSNKTVFSVLKSEIMTFADAFQILYTFTHDVKNILKAEILFRMLVNSKSLSNVWSKPACTTKNWIMIDVQTIRDTYHALELSRIVLIRSESIISPMENNIAYALIIIKTISNRMKTFINKNFDHSVQLWFIRIQNWKVLHKKKWEACQFQLQCLRVQLEYNLHVRAQVCTDSLHYSLLSSRPLQLSITLGSQFQWQNTK